MLTKEKQMLQKFVYILTLIPYSMLYGRNYIVVHVRHNIKILV